MLTAERLREVLSFDRHTGEFKWLIALSRRVQAGAVAGSKTHYGYSAIRIDGKIYPAHRLAWLHMHGDWPVGQIDHINTIKTDNSERNLRDVTRTVNQQNRKQAQSNSKTGLLGVCFDKRKSKYLAQIKAPGRGKFIGYFDDSNDAQAAYLDAKRKSHEGCTV